LLPLDNVGQRTARSLAVRCWPWQIQPSAVRYSPPPANRTAQRDPRASPVLIVDADGADARGRTENLRFTKRPGRRPLPVRRVLFRA